jgi:hypothetical protein
MTIGMTLIRRTWLGLVCACGGGGGEALPPPPAFVATVEVAPDSLRLEVGDVGRGTCTPRNDDGTALADRCQWVSADPGVVQATTDVQVANLTARRSGDAWIVATSGDASDSTRVTVVDPDLPPPPPPPTSAACPAAEFARIVQVSTSSQLAAALRAAAAGDLILLAEGVYTGEFVISTAATASEPICLDGVGKAVLTAATLRGGSYALYLNRAEYWRITGLEIHTAEKGVMIDYSSFNLFDGVFIHDIGNEALHFRRHSSDNEFRRGRIERTGLQGDPHSGEGAYFGSAAGNWARYTGGQPDRADRNRLIETVIRNTTAECVEAKEGTRGTVVRLNSLSECGDAETNSPSVLGTRGGAGLFECNAITTRASVDGISVYSGGPLDGDGDDNVFRWNRIEVQGSGEAIAFSDGQTGNLQVDNNAGAHAANCGEVASAERTPAR